MRRLAPASLLRYYSVLCTTAIVFAHLLHPSTAFELASRFFHSTNYHNNDVSSSSSSSSSSVCCDRYAEIEEKGRQAFLQWAKTRATPIVTTNPIDDDTTTLSRDDDDLKAIAAAIGDAPVVALSEGFHNCREMMSLHHRIIRYLVQHHGFNTVISESGLPESRIIHDYVLGVTHDNNDDDDQNDADDADDNEEEEQASKDRMFQKGLNKMYSEWVEGRDLIEWMCRYNRHHDNILHYYGSDIGGFYHDWKTPFDMILKYLSQVDNSFAEDLAHDMKPYLELMSQNARLNYQENLSPLDQSKLEVILDQALFRMDSNRDQYIAAAAAALGKNRDGGETETEYEWARQSLESMRLAEHYYRNYRQVCHPETSKLVGLHGREVAMHRNVLWALEQRKRQGIKPKAIIIHHVVHTKTESQYQGDIWGFFTPAGEMLRHSLGNQYYTIGMVYGRGKFWQGWQKGRGARVTATIPPPTSSGLEATLQKVKQKCIFLPWETAPVTALPWLSKTSSMRENDYFFNIRPREWNACIYIEDAHPATPVSIARTPRSITKIF